MTFKNEGFSSIKSFKEHLQPVPSNKLKYREGNCHCDLVFSLDSIMCFNNFQTCSKYSYITESCMVTEFASKNIFPTIFTILVVDSKKVFSI